MLVARPPLPPHFPWGILVFNFCLQQPSLENWLCVPGEAHPACWDYVAAVRQTGARSLYLRGGSRDCGDRNHGEDGESLGVAYGTVRILTRLLVMQEPYKPASGAAVPTSRAGLDRQ